MTDQEEKLIFKSGCTSNSNKIYSILKNLEYLPIKKATEQESIERAEALPQIDNYQIHLTNEVDKRTTLYTITLYEDGFFMFAPGQDLGFSGDITKEPHTALFENFKLMLDEFAEN